MSLETGPQMVIHVGNTLCDAMRNYSIGIKMCFQGIRMNLSSSQEGTAMNPAPSEEEEDQNSTQRAANLVESE